MVKLSLCIEPVLTELDFYDRIKAAADLGYDAVEFWALEGKDVNKIGRLARDNNIAVSICCAKGAWSCRMNSQADDIIKNISESIKLAKDMGCNSLIVISGDVDDKGDMQKYTLIENLKRTADIAVKEDVTINLEALNSLVDHKGYYVDSSRLGFEIINSVGCSHIKLLYDIYHMQIMEGNIIENITKNIDYIGHFHSAGVPGRHELFMGEINYRNVIEAIDNAGYDRYFGLEYIPTYEHVKSIADVKRYLINNSI
ncbi:MAG TPA: TIM barrel protein [Clostridiales bacterium]|nr:TIM barrel protein [Clostridiales bacterium]